jgi:spore maturation protein CgeB
MLRILFIGDNWYGSNARSCADALRRLGCDVLDIDIQTFIPNASLFSSRVARRLWWSRLVDELNLSILRTAGSFRPDILVAFKGNYIDRRTLRSLRANGIPLYNYFPDTSAFNHGKWLPRSLPEYDCVFYTKRFWYADVAKKLDLKAAQFLPHGYDQELHRPMELDARDIVDYRCDVSFIAHHSRYKENYLEGLIRLRPNLNLCIWGIGWTERCESTEVRRYIKGFPLLGERYPRAIQCARINLALMNGPVTGASSADLTTSRTYTIPATGGFMLHERNSEILELYKEYEEIACFDCVEELADKIDYFLAHPAERESIARAGHARCVPAYSYDNRMAEILSWHFDHCDIGRPQTALAGL